MCLHVMKLPSTIVPSTQTGTEDAQHGSTPSLQRAHTALSVAVSNTVTSLHCFPDDLNLFLVGVEAPFLFVANLQGHVSSHCSCVPLVFELTK